MASDFFKIAYLIRSQRIFHIEHLKLLKFFYKPQMCINQFGSESVSYMGTDSQKHQCRIESYSPKFVENIVQAIARDLLCYAIRNLSDRYIVAHVHDEVVIECPADVKYQEICDIMGQTPRDQFEG